MLFTGSTFSHFRRIAYFQLLYGYNSRDPLRFAKVQATRDLFYVEDRELEIEQIINECRLPSAPRQVTFKCHWLAIDGVQPDIPQNPPKPARKAAGASGDATEGEGAAAQAGLAVARITDEVEVKPAVRHVLTKEQQVFFEKICGAVTGPDANYYHAAINSLRSDKGLHQLMPYFCKFITDRVAEFAGQKFNLKILVAMMKMIEALLMNSEIHVDHYVRGLLPVTRFLLGQF